MRIEMMDEVVPLTPLEVEEQKFIFTPSQQRLIERINKKLVTLLTVDNRVCTYGDVMTQREITEAISIYSKYGWKVSSVSGDCPSCDRGKNYCNNLSFKQKKPKQGNFICKLLYCLRKFCCK